MPTCPPPSKQELLLLSRPAEDIWGTLNFHQIILITSCVLTIGTFLITVWLIVKHLRRYTVPNEQRQIIRMVFTPVVYSALSTGSIANYRISKYLTPLQDIYESFAFVSLFLLFNEFIEPDKTLRTQLYHDLPRMKRRMKKYVPGGSLKWYNATWVFAFQLCINMPILMIVEIITQATNSFCNSLSPEYAHVWIFVLQKVTIILGVVTVVRFYRRMKASMAARRPLFKLVSFKLVVAVNFFQNILFSVLSAQGVLDGNAKTTAPDMSIGVPQFVTCGEQLIFAIFFHYAFRSTEYDRSQKTGVHDIGFLPAIADALNPTDLVKGIWKTFRLIFTGQMFRDKFAPTDGHEFTQLETEDDTAGVRRML